MYLTLELLEMTLKTSPIPTRNWKNSKDPVSERDRKRKESQQSVDRRIHYLWFHFLRLCLELESIGHVFEKKGGGGKIIQGKGKPVKVNRDVYVGWDLENLRGMKFNDWYYGDNKRDLFNEGGFKYSGRPQYHSLVKKFNVFIEYMNGDKSSYEKEMDLCEKIIKEYQKERFERLQRTDSKTGKPLNREVLDYKRIVKGDIKDCEQMILSICEGRFPKRNIF